MRQGKKYKKNDEDREFVRRSVMAGTRIEDIAAALNLHDDTLRKHYRYEIVTAREILKGRAAACLDDAIAAGNVDAAKFVLSRIAGWRETSVNEHVGEGGSPISVNVTIGGNEENA